MSGIALAPRRAVLIIAACATLFAPAAGLAGEGSAAPLLRQAFAERPDCVLLDGTLVDCVPAVELEHALVALSPLFAAIPDVRGRGTPPDLAHTVRSALGID